MGETQKNEAYGTIYISYRFSLSNIISSMGEDMSSFTELEGAKHTYHTIYIYIYMYILQVYTQQHYQ